MYRSRRECMELQALLEAGKRQGKQKPWNKFPNKCLRKPYLKHFGNGI
jgi:hypothetical protein